MIFNQTEFGHIAIAMRWRWCYGRTCSGHPRLPPLKRGKQGVDSGDKRGHDGERNCRSNAMAVALALLSPTALLGENAATGTDL